MTDLDPAKFHILNAAQKRLLLIALVFFTFVGLPIFSFLYYSVAINRPAQTIDDSSFTIDSGMSLEEISKGLYRQDLINSEFMFKLYLVLSGSHTKIQAGVYKIPAGASAVFLADLFKHGTNDKPITFLEGWRLEEFALEAAENLEKVDFENFIRIARPYEGYLFPDTYNISASIDESELVELLRNNFSNKTEDLLTETNLQKAGLSKEQAVILASIVEREVHAKSDRPIVAGILIKRLKNDELLGADATTQYAVDTSRICPAVTSIALCIPSKEQVETVDFWPVVLYQADLDSESPYNTRKLVGLPPLPISNPGFDALESVVNHKITDFNFYLTDSKGITHYARTLAEHNSNVATYLR